MIISLIIPCYNESKSLPFLYEALQDIKTSFESYSMELIFIDDGSKDDTLDQLRNLSKNDTDISYISFSRNFGKEAAMYAGLTAAKGDYVAIMDADMQDPPSLLPHMMQTMLEQNCDVVATRRVSRKGEPPIRSFFARCFYRLINKMSDVDIVDGARDFRLMKRAVVNAIIDVSERQRFSKGIFSWVGFETFWVEYENVERVAGETKWSFWKLFKYAVEGIVAFTTVPLRLATLTGFIVSCSAFAYMVYYVIRALILRLYDQVPGYPSLLSIILFLGGLILLALGILGEYLARTYMEVKQRPLYIAKEQHSPESTEHSED